jgi:DNA-binding response OmpR family regulator
MNHDDTMSASKAAVKVPTRKRGTKSGPTILIVDDSADQIAQLHGSLQPYGAAIVVCDQPAEALARAEQLQPDIILLSSTLHGADSEQICRQLKESTIAYGIPVIFISGHDDPQARVRGLRVGAVDYLAPPHNRAELLERIRIHWRGRRMHRKLKRKVLEQRPQYPRIARRRTNCSAAGFT